MASLGLRWGGYFISTLLGGILQARIGLQDVLGGGVKTFTSTHTPLEHCPRDVIRPPENWKTPPLLDIHKHPPPPLDIARMTSSTFRGGGGDRSRSRTHTLLHRLFYQYHTITKNLKYALVMKHQIYRLKVDGANLGIVGGIVLRPWSFCQPVWHKRSFAAAIHPALG